MKNYLAKLSPASFSLGVLLQLGIAAPLSLAIAVFATIALGVEVAGVIEKAQPAVIDTAKIKRKPLAAPEYKAIAGRLADLSSSVKVVAQPEGVAIYVEKAANWPELIYTIGALSTVDGTVLWSMSSFCINECKPLQGVKDVAAHRAILSGARQSVEIGG